MLLLQLLNHIWTFISTLGFWVPLVFILLYSIWTNQTNRASYNKWIAVDGEIRIELERLREQGFALENAIKELTRKVGALPETLSALQKILSEKGLLGEGEFAVDKPADKEKYNEMKEGEVEDGDERADEKRQDEIETKRRERQECKERLRRELTSAGSEKADTL